MISVTALWIIPKISSKSMRRKGGGGGDDDDDDDDDDDVIKLQGPNTNRHSRESAACRHYQAWAGLRRGMRASSCGDDAYHQVLLIERVLPPPCFLQTDTDDRYNGFSVLLL